MAPHGPLTSSPLCSGHSGHPSKLHPGSLPAQSLTRFWGQRIGCRSAGVGVAGGMNQNSRKEAYFQFRKATDGTRFNCLPSSICMRKQKSSKSLGMCKPAAMRSKPVTANKTLAPASCHIRLPEIKGGRLPTSCWQKEDIYSHLLFESLLGGKSFNVSS